MRKDVLCRPLPPRPLFLISLSSSECRVVHVTAAVCRKNGNGKRDNEGTHTQSHTHVSDDGNDDVCLRIEKEEMRCGEKRKEEREREREREMCVDY